MDPRILARAKKIEAAKEAAKERFSPLIAVFNGQLGQDALTLLEDEYVFNTTHVPGDPYHSAFCEGQRSLVLWLRDVVKNNGEENA